MKPSDSSLVAFTVAILGIATFAGMDALMKGLSLSMGAYNVLLWRGFFAVALAGLLFFGQRLSWPVRRVMALHIWRGIVISLMAFMFFWGLVRVPLAEAIGLSFIAPLIAMYLAVVILGEKVGRMAVSASLLGLAGALVIISGSLSGDFKPETGKGVASILLSAVLYAYNLILQRQQALVAEPAEIAFFQNSAMLLVYLAVAPWFAVVPGLTILPGVAAAAAVSIFSTMLLSWAYARAEAKILIPVEYTAFVWAALLGWLFFGEPLTVSTLIGTVLIVIGCLVAARQGPDEPVPHVETTAV